MNAMVRHAVMLLDPAGSDQVLDLFVGWAISPARARLANSVVGVKDAGWWRKPVRRGAQWTQCHISISWTANLDTAWLGAYDKVLIDHAIRRRTAAALAATAARRLVYVSCHPASLARDAGMLVHELGYGLTSAGVMDMFPHTAHVESIAVFERTI
jgi:23S rRNA (uracil1939-C5)-methyltransferase